MKTIIVGGVAAGASTAARLRRLNEDMEILMLERGDFISYANCGLPYHLGGVIEDRDDLLVMTPEAFKRRFNVEVRVKEEAIEIDRPNRELAIRRRDGTVYREKYDKLVLATGSSPVIPPIPGIDGDRVFYLWTLADMDRVLGALGGSVKRALVVGAGFIGLETAENLRLRGMEVTVVEMRDSILPQSLDREMTGPILRELDRAGITLLAERGVASLRESADGVSAVLDNGRAIDADIVIMSVGVRPNGAIAQAAGLAMGERGHIKVDATQRTSDPDIYAAGDVVEVIDPILGGTIAIPLAGPASKQARVLADNISGRSSMYRGSIGSAVVKLGELTAASVGYSEARLKQRGVPYDRIYVNALSNAGYYPDSVPLHLKLIFAGDGKILGAQAVGGKGADKRIDVIATVLRLGGTVRDLAGLELCYSPPYNSVRDPVNIAGMIAANVLDGLSRPVYPDKIPDDGVIVDLREPSETDKDPVPGTVNIPLGQLRERLGELDKSRPAVALCHAGLRGYVGERILKQNGFDAYNLSGGYVTWRMHRPADDK